MSSLAGHKWYVAALVLVLGAIAAQFLAKHHAGRGMTAMARAAAMPVVRLQSHQIAAWHSHRSDLLNLVGFGFAVLAVGSWLLSRRRREPGPQGVLPALLFVYVLLLLLIV